MKEAAGYNQGYRDAFTRIAVWQFMAFIILLIFAWAVEIIDVPALLFDAPPSEFSLYRAITMTAAIICCAIIAVGHTYEQQRRLISQIKQRCPYCHKVLTGKDNWEHVADYFMRHYPMKINQDACPSCRSMLADVESHIKQE